MYIITYAKKSDVTAADHNRNMEMRKPEVKTSWNQLEARNSQNGAPLPDLSPVPNEILYFKQQSGRYSQNSVEVIEIFHKKMEEPEELTSKVLEKSTFNTSKHQRADNSLTLEGWWIHICM